LGRKEHVNVLFIAKLVKAIRIAMLQYKEANNEGHRKAPRYDVEDPVVIEGGVGLADEVDKSQMAAQLRRIGTRIWLLTEYDSTTSKWHVHQPRNTSRRPRGKIKSMVMRLWAATTSKLQPLRILRRLAVCCASVEMRI
jgi:hypothetical protein